MSAPDIVSFLRDRLAEDQAVAEAAREDGEWILDVDWVTALNVGVRSTVAPGYLLPEQWAHIARHAPARVLAGVAAKRLIIAQYEQAEPTDITRCVTLSDVVQNMAVEYAAHPDYNSEWAPDGVEEGS